MASTKRPKCARGWCDVQCECLTWHLHTFISRDLVHQACNNHDNFVNTFTKGNCLHTNICMGKSLTHHIRLKYKQIHACNFTCVLYKGLWVKSNHCPKYDIARYKQIHCTKIHVKVLHHFWLSPLKRMHRSPNILELLQWHANPKSIGGLVYHVTNFMACANIDIMIWWILQAWA
jgi:hypothetical protein